MNGITIPMAIIDFIPVVLFFAAAVVLQRDLYNKMVKGAFALLAAGSIMVLVSGIYKALWKILYATGVCDYEVLGASMFLFQGPGFVFVFLALLGMFTKYNKQKDENVGMMAAAPAVYASNLPFIALQVVGCGGAQWCLFAMALKMKKRLAATLFVVAFVFMLGMGYLGVKFDDSSSMHWLAQITNIISQGALLGGVLLLHKAGLGDRNALAAS